MQERETPLQMIIDRLSNPVRAYFAIGIKLEDKTLNDRQRKEWKEERLRIFNTFDEANKKELVEHIEFLNQHYERDKSKNISPRGR